MPDRRELQLRVELPWLGGAPVPPKPKEAKR